MCGTAASLNSLKGRFLTDVDPWARLGPYFAWYCGPRGSLLWRAATRVGVRSNGSLIVDRDDIVFTLRGVNGYHRYSAIRSLQ